MSEVKRYEAVHLRYDDNNIRYGDGCEVEVVLASDYATLEAENAKLRAELERREVPDGWKLVPVERIKVALECVQNAMEDAYNNAYQNCCGRGNGQCCGEPEPAWSDADHAIMDALAPAQRELSSLLAAAPSAPKADDPVKQMLLEALELCERSMRSVLPDFNPFDQAAYDKARAAIAAARKGGKV